MVVKRQCSFCAAEIEPGTGTMFVRRDGTVYNFCSSSCRKQQLSLHRVGHRLKWTRAYSLKRASERATAAPATSPAESTAKPARRGPRRPAPRPETKATTPLPPETPAKKPRAPRKPAAKPAKATESG